MKRTTFEAAVRRLLDALAIANDDTVAAIARHGASISPLRDRGSTPSGAKHRPDYDIELVASELGVKKDRSDGLRYLQDQQLTGRELRALAKQTDTPTLKSDPVDLLREKIVDNIIGYKARSSAIRYRSPQS